MLFADYEKSNINILIIGKYFFSILSFLKLSMHIKI